MHEAIRALTHQRDEHLERRDRLKADIVTIQQSIKQKREAQAAHQRVLEAQARHNIPELRFWEHCLGLKIEASGNNEGNDQLRFVYSCVDERDSDRECWFELDMGGKEYEIAGTQPKLERDRVCEVVERLNNTRELGWFLKNMRRLFVEVLKR